MKAIFLLCAAFALSITATAQTLVNLEPITECYDVNGVPVSVPRGFRGVWMPSWAEPEDFVYTGPLLRNMLQDSVELIECDDGNLVVSPGVCE